MSAASSGPALALALVACVGAPPPRTVQHPPVLAALRPHAGGAIASYDVTLDRWLVATAGELATIDVAPVASVASPEALRHVVASELRRPDATFTIESRESLSDGFATTLVEHAARTTIVVRQLGSTWVRCVGALALCKAVKRGGG